MTRQFFCITFFLCLLTAAGSNAQDTRPPEECDEEDIACEPFFNHTVSAQERCSDLSSCDACLDRALQAAKDSRDRYQCAQHRGYCRVDCVDKQCGNTGKETVDIIQRPCAKYLQPAELEAEVIIHFRCNYECGDDDREPECEQDKECQSKLMVFEDRGTCGPNEDCSQCMAFSCMKADEWAENFQCPATSGGSCCNGGEPGNCQFVRKIIDRSESHCSPGSETPNWMCLRGIRCYYSCNKDDPEDCTETGNETCGGIRFYKSITEICGTEQESCAACNDRISEKLKQWQAAINCPASTGLSCCSNGDRASCVNPTKDSKFLKTDICMKDHGQWSINGQADVRCAYSCENEPPRAPA